MLKKILFAAACFLSVATLEAQQLRTPQPSTTQTIKQDLGIGTVELSYSRPNMKGRKIFGELVPFGNVWRTGANNATTLTFSDSVTIGGTKIAPGKYGLLSIPNKDNWTLIISKQTNVTSPAAYKQESDLVRVNVKPKEIDDKVETFTIQFANIRPNGADLQIMWDETAVTLPIVSDFDSRVAAQINSLMFNDNRPYFQAAMYYMETGRDMNTALTWLDKAVAAQPNAFWIHHQRANALAKLGRKAEAKQAAERSMSLAREAQNGDYVKLNEDLLKTLN